MIRSFTYSADEPGPRLLILGAVHGNEICGTVAIRRVMEELDSGKVKLLRGHVEFVPIANPRAHEAGKRFIERNLNRFFLPSKQPTNYEEKLTNILSKMMEACDYFIDLHSTTAGGVPFASIEGSNKDEQELAAAMGAEAVIYGWDDAYKAGGRVNPDPNESVGTTAFARQHGAKAVLLECGQHKDPVSVDVAYRAIRKAMRHIGLIEEVEKITLLQPLVLRITHVVFRGENGSFVESWGNFSPVKAGQEIAKLADGSVLSSATDAFIVLPNPNTPPGTEWYYIGERV